MILLHVFKNYVLEAISASFCKYEIGGTGMKLYKINKEKIFLCRSTGQNGNREFTFSKMLSIKNGINRGLFYRTSFFLTFKIYFPVLCLLLPWSQTCHLWLVQTANWEIFSINYWHQMLNFLFFFLSFLFCFLPSGLPIGHELEDFWVASFQFFLFAYPLNV